MNERSLPHPTASAVAPLYTRREAAALLRLSPRQLSNLVLAGEMPVARFGGVIRFHRADLEAFVAGNTGRVVKSEQGGAH